MKVAFANRKDCLINRGGDTTQMLKTKKWLEDKYSVDIHLCLSPDEITKEYDLVHIFDI
ncbi:hypothetical protein [Traorella massiliensis]|uniref:hypothetical protein n=1 Tax=Traorella massiliensis TaxID=1903263 RepID=UPI0012B51100|nr:hypothetical protein [Traorella massiliensis]